MSRFLPVLIGLILITISASAGFFLGQRNAPKPPAFVDPLTGFFNTQSATVRGTITKKEGNLLTVKNAKGITQNFNLSKDATIAFFDANKKLSTPSADLTKLELNKDAVLTLRKASGTFSVVAVSYIP